MFKIIICNIPYILLLDIAFTILFAVYISYIVMFYMSQSDLLYLAGKKKNTKITFSGAIKGVLKLIIGVPIVYIIYTIIETELFLHHKKSTCFIYREIKELIES